MSQYNVVENSVSPGTDVQTLTGNNPVAVPATGNNINIIGTGGVLVTGNAGTSTLTISVSGSGLTWNVIGTMSEAMAVNNGYFTNNAGTSIALTLPPTSNVGDYISIVGMAAGGWNIVQGMGQQVRIGSAISTAGAGGSVTSFEAHDAIDLVCAIANTLWIADGGPQSAGLTVV